MVVCTSIQRKKRNACTQIIEDQNNNKFLFLILRVNYSKPPCGQVEFHFAYPQFETCQFTHLRIKTYVSSYNPPCPFLLTKRLKIKNIKKFGSNFTLKQFFLQKLKNIQRFSSSQLLSHQTISKHGTLPPPPPTTEKPTKI